MLASSLWSSSAARRIDERQQPGSSLYYGVGPVVAKGFNVGRKFMAE